MAAGREALLSCEHAPCQQRSTSRTAAALAAGGRDVSRPEAGCPGEEVGARGCVQGRVRRQGCLHHPQQPDPPGAPREAGRPWTRGIPCPSGKVGGAGGAPGSWRPLGF